MRHSFNIYLKDILCEEVSNKLFFSEIFYYKDHIKIKFLDVLFPENLIFIEYDLLTGKKIYFINNPELLEQEVNAIIAALWFQNKRKLNQYADLDDIKTYLKENYLNSFKTISFLLYSDHGFKQAPYETITKDQYDGEIVKVKPITSISITEDSFEVSECSSNGCPIK